MNYCRRCILPDTRPNLRLDDAGICNACRSHESRPRIDWAAREALFRDAAANARRRSQGYDCLIPVSGGKDSHWQVIKCLEHGLHPLAVTWKTPARTALGQQNLDNLIRLGVDHIDYQINPIVERKFSYLALKRCGSPAIPMHMALFSIPLTLALSLKIPLVVWGENSAFEYGNAAQAHTGFRLTSEWLRTYGVTQGTTADDWVGSDLSRADLTPYFGPTADALDAGVMQAVFLGYYFPWDPETTLHAARARGFVARAAGPKVGYYDYADIDDDFIIPVHHFLKWYKFGFTRLYDNLSLEIRNGRMTRAEAIELVRAAGDPTPTAEIVKLCAYLGISQDAFHALIEPFRNRDVWVQREGRWEIEGFLISDWAWR